MTHRTAISILISFLLIYGILGYYAWEFKQHEHEVMFLDSKTCDCSNELRDVSQDGALALKRTERHEHIIRAMNSLLNSVNAGFQSVHVFIAEDGVELKEIRQRLEKLEKRKQGCGW